MGGALVASSCADQLDVNPRQSLTPATAFVDLAGYNGLALNMYGRTRAFGYYGQTMMIAPEVLADNVLVIANTGRYIQEEVNADRAGIGIWNLNSFGAINDANIIIAGVDGATGTDEVLRNRIKGEAFFMRAMYHFDLARVYGYEPGREVNGWNKATVIRTTPTLGFSDADLRARSTNVEVYTQVEADLLQAISLLPTANLGSPNVYRASKAAAQALLARVYLYWGRNDRAEALATEAMATAGLTNDGTGLVTSANYVSSFNTFPNPESLFEVEIRQVDWSTVDGVNNSISSLSSNAIAGAQFILSASLQLIASYEPGDIRLQTWTATTRAGFAGPVYSSNKWRGAKGLYLENLPILRASELYLIRAEARSKTGNEAGARADLNALRSKRNLGPVDAGLSGNALFERILQEKRVEFALEGHRFFDLKRNGLDIRKHRNLPAVPFADYRVLNNLPLGELQLNDKLEQNPGY
ncbi:RagB/SusD family nutrient uptake outer membrane protein [Algoriphagus sp.]|uniref:RagB/SusD family nutrient uptake outer membrane protein n=1 Tax=Algoriphagus sp. TaxID=1872435 RepID=UPI003919A179